MQTSVKHKSTQAPGRRGFTIVELLIVIVVIGILAAISIIAYNGIQSRAQAAAVSSALDQTNRKLALYAVDNGVYPPDLATAGINNSAGGTSYQYSVNNAVSPQTYCVTVTDGTTSYKASSATPIPSSGGCPGHGVGGVGAVTNLSRNPKGVGLSSAYFTSGWFSPLGSTTDTANVSFGGNTDWHDFIASTVGNAIMRERINLSDLVNGQTYTASVLVANAGAAAFTVELDFCDQGSVNFTINPGETRRITTSGMRASYDSTYSFVDVQPLTLGGTDGILVNNAMLTSGATLYNYADGNSANWIWNGAVSASTSTGPPL